MAHYDFDIGVLGGGSAGLTTAAGSSILGAKALLIEKENKLGGDCLHYGCVPSKTLIKSAHVYHQMKQAEKFGLPAVVVPPVDYAKVSQRIQSVIEVIQHHDSAERFCQLGTRVEFGGAKFLDPHTVDLEGHAFSAKYWVIATGSSPSIPNIEGLNSTPYITNKEIFYLDRLPESLIVLGGGPIACEMAQAFARLGSQVTMLQRSGHILSKEDADMADALQQTLEAEGVTVYVGTTLEKVRDLGHAREVTVTLKATGETTTVQADTLLAALGRIPNLDGLGLEDIGVEYTAKGLILDDRLRTTQKHIYGAGDVTGDYQFTHAAGYEGGIVIRNTIFHLPTKVNYANLPWCTYTDPELASIGLNEKAAQAAGVKYTVWTEPFKSNDRSLAEGEETGWIKMLVDDNEKPLGVQILGPQAGELISEWVAVMNGKVKLSTLYYSVHPYPTIAEINKRVVGNMMSSKLSERVKAGLKFFFNLRGRACGADS